MSAAVTDLPPLAAQHHYQIRALLSEVRELDRSAFNEAVTMLLGNVPPNIDVTAAEAYSPDESIGEPLSQTWDWPGAPHALEHVRASLIVRDHEHEPTDRKARLHRFCAVVRALIRHLPVVAIHWEPAQRLIDPRAFVDALAHGATVVDHAVNVRLFRISDGRPGEMLMDTLGLDAFGLPDLQCHFAGTDPSQMGPVLASYAEYLFDKGDVLNDESMIRGIASIDEWPCERGMSLAPPSRVVVDIRPDSLWVPT